MVENFQSDNFERSALQGRIEEAQELGFECVLSVPGGEHAVIVRPQDSAELALRELHFPERADFHDVELQVGDTDVQALEVAFISSGSIINGQGGVSETEIKAFISQYPLEEIASLQELTQLIEQEFGSCFDWRVWESFMENLPDTLPESVQHRIFVPMLEAGELPVDLAILEQVLTRNDWSEAEISASYCRIQRRVRAKRQDFLEETGVHYSQINTANDLTDAIFLTLDDYGSFSALALIRSFILSHETEYESQKLLPVIAPFMSLFGMSGYDDMLAELMELDDFSPYGWPRYTGGFTWYGDW